MNVLGETYIADKLAAYQIKMRAAWRLRCVEWSVQDEADTTTPTT